MKRKITSLLMAFAMALSLAVPAFASTSLYWEYPDSGSTDLEQTLTFAATTKVPTIALTMPVVGANPVILNPYQIEYTGDVTLNGVDNGAANATDQTKQIISPVYAIKNESDVPLKASVKTTSTVAGEFKFATAAVTDPNEKNKSAYVQIEFGVDTTGPIAATAANEQTIPAQSKTDAGSTVITLKAGDVSTAAATPISIPRPAVSGTTITPNYLLFQFVGSAAKNPTKGWTADDKFTTVMTFTFLPGGNTVSGGNQQQAATPAMSVSYKADKSDAAVPTYDLAAVISDEDATPAWTVTAAGNYGATISAAGVLSVTKSSVDAKIDSDSLVVGGTITDTITVTYSDGSATQTVNVPLTITLT